VLILVIVATTLDRAGSMSSGIVKYLCEYFFTRNIYCTMISLEFGVRCMSKTRNNESKRNPDSEYLAHSPCICKAVESPEPTHILYSH
jgi:predicted dinucleotide-utilizing enzyme